MTKISVKDAALQLDSLIRLADNGEEVVLTIGDHPAARMVPVVGHNTIHFQRKAGSGKGLFILSDDFDEPLADFVDYTE